MNKPEHSFTRRIVYFIACAIPAMVLIQSTVQIFKGFVYRTAVECPVGQYLGTSCTVLHLDGLENINRLSELMAISLEHFICAAIGLALLHKLLGTRRAKKTQTTSERPAALAIQVVDRNQERVSRRVPVPVASAWRDTIGLWREHPFWMVSGCLVLYGMAELHAWDVVHTSARLAWLVGSNVLVLCAPPLLGARIARYSVQRARGTAPALAPLRWTAYVRLVLWFIGVVVAAVVCALMYLAALQTWQIPEPARGEWFRGGVVIMACVIVILHVRFSLLFPHVASGGRFAWRACWLDTSEHFWTIVGCGLVTTIPLLVAVVVIVPLVGLLSYGLIPAFAEPLCVRPLASIVCVTGMVNFFAYVARLYETLGVRLGAAHHQA